MTENQNRNCNGWRTLARERPGWVELAAYPFPGGYNPYCVEWYRLDTPLKLMRWIRHLSGKRWFTPEMCADLIDATAAHFGWEVEGEL